MTRLGTLVPPFENFSVKEYVTIASVPLAVTTRSPIVKSTRPFLRHSSTYSCLLNNPAPCIYTKFDAICDSTFSQSFDFTASHISRSYCSAPVAFFQELFFGCDHKVHPVRNGSNETAIKAE